MFSSAVRLQLSKLFQKEFVQTIQADIVKRTCTSQTMDFKTLKVTRPRDFVVQVEMNRPEKRNAMNSDFWRDMQACFSQLAHDDNCRAIVLSGAGKVYSAGLDLMDNKEINLQGLMASEIDVARKGFQLRKSIFYLQETFNCIERCSKPVIAAIHAGCIGGGIDMVSACDIRYGSSGAWFSIKEVDIGLAADLGTLQRFPKVIGNESLARELAFTARKMHADEAMSVGFISRIFPDRESLIAGSLELASLIASKSPVAVQGTKISMVYSRDHSVQDGLDHVASWNQGMVQSEDVTTAVMAGMNKENPVFSKL